MKPETYNRKRPPKFVARFTFQASGFTLLEMMIATGIFAVVIITAVGAMLSLNQAQIKAENIQNIQDNVRFTLESMTKELRTGTAYAPGSCGPGGCTQVTFVRQDGTNIGYCLDSGTVKKFISPVVCSGGSPITSSAVTVNRLYFYVVGQIPGPSDGQPRVTVIIDAFSSSPSPQLETTLNLETTVTSRVRDL